MTPKELEKIGNKLYGNYWQIHLAKKLKVDARTVRRWKSGDTPVPEPVAVAITGLLDSCNAWDLK